MALETSPASRESTGKWRITYVPSASAALSVAILNGVTAKPLTYSFTPDGFNRNITQAKVEDKRLTKTQVLNRPGNSTEEIEVKYIESVDAASADAILTEGSTGQLVLRRGVDNATTHIIGQIADVVTYVAGKKRPDAPTENGLDTVSQTLYLTADTVERGVLIA